jgi:hypothetical protein
MADAPFSLGGSDETVTCVEIKPMADGSGRVEVLMENLPEQLAHELADELRLDLRPRTP